MRAWWAKLRSLLAGRRRLDTDLREEMAAHLEFEIEERLERGMTAEEARADARRRFGNAARIAEDTRDAWSFPHLEGLLRDLRYALRAMARRPAFSTVAVLSLAIALGANTAVFSFANAILLKALPVARADRLAVLRQRNEQFHMENCCFGYAFFRELRKRKDVFADVAAVTSPEIDLADRGQTQRLQGELVSGNYFRMLGVHPAAGRLLDEADDAVEGAGWVCVISYQLWQERFAGDPGVIGRRVLLNNAAFQIVGVTEAGFRGASLHQPRDLQAPTAMNETFWGAPRDRLVFTLVARLNPGVTRAEAEARLNVEGKRIPRNTSGALWAPHDRFLLYDGRQGVDLDKEQQEQARRPVLLLLLLVAVLLLVACANLAALLLVRSVERTREAGMRAAIGASRSVLFRQFFAEAALLAGSGGAAGWVLALVLIRVLLGLLPRDETMASLVRPDAAVFGFSAAATIAAGLLFGLLPAWRASRADPLAAIHNEAFARPGRRAWLSGAVIAGQIALSLALVFSAGLFTRTLRNLRAVDLGFRPENLVSIPIDLRRTTYARQAPQLFAETLRRVRELPETRAASLAWLSVVSGEMGAVVIDVPGYVPPDRIRPVTYIIDVSGGYFRTLGTPLLAGRDFTDRDGDGSQGEGAAIVNEQFARQFFGRDALGKAFAYGGFGRKVRIVGIARTAKFRTIREEPQPVMYLPVMPSTTRLFVQMRVAGATGPAIEHVRALLHDLAPGLPFGPATTMEMQIDAALSRERLLAFLSTLLGAVAAALAAIGLYGVLSFAVTRRTREIGIRLSVGAQRSRILGQFLKESAWTVAAGLAAGIPLTLGAGRLASSLLYGVKGEDTGTLAAAAAALGLISLAAALVPAVRAARIDPMQALRHE